MDSWVIGVWFLGAFAIGGTAFMLGGYAAVPRAAITLWGVLALWMIIGPAVWFHQQYAIVRRSILSATSRAQTTLPQWDNPYRPISVIGHKYKNEQVVLDGYSYSGCTFENVTFVYNGTTAIQLHDNQIIGLPMISTDNPSVGGTATLFKGLGLLSPIVKLNLPPSNIVEEPHITP